MGDAIAGSGGPGEALVVGANYTHALPKEIGDHIAAMVFYGDPRHMPDQPYDIFNNNVTGVHLSLSTSSAILLTALNRSIHERRLSSKLCYRIQTYFMTTVTLGIRYALAAIISLRILCILSFGTRKLLRLFRAGWIYVKKADLNV